MHKENFKPLSVEEERTGKLIVNAAYVVHKAMGPGLLEKVYEVCFCHILTKDGCTLKRQLDIPIVFDGIVFSEGFRLDVMVNDLAICDFVAKNNRGMSSNNIFNLTEKDKHLKLICYGS